MRFGLAFVLSLLCLDHACAALSTAPSSLLPLDGFRSLRNSTLGFPEPPDSFHVSFEIGGPKLHRTACLLNTVEALKQLALGDFQAKIIDGTEYKLDSYPQVSILVSTFKRRRNIQARFVIWGIVLGVHEIVSRKKFEFAQFEIKWNGDILGWVHIENNPPTPGLAIGGSHVNDTLNVAKRSVMPSNATSTYGTNITDIITTDATVDPGEARLNTVFTPFGNNVGIYDVFFPIMDSLADMAEHSATHQTQGLVAGYDGSKAVICLLATLPLRKSPPFLELQWVIRTISRIPLFMVEGHRFGEIGIKIEVDGAEIASGRLSNMPVCL